MLSIGKQIVPKRVFAKLKFYCFWGPSSMYITSSIGKSATHRFRLNSIYDPDYAAGGTQPTGYSQYAALYGRYRVHACKVSSNFVRCHAAATSNDVQGKPIVAFICAQPPENAISYDTPDAIVEGSSRYSAWSLLWDNPGGYRTATVTDYATCDPKNVKKYFNIKSIIGYYDGGDDTAAFGANPSRNCFVDIGITTADGIAPTTNSDYYVGVWSILTYYCEFYQPKAPYTL